MRSTAETHASNRRNAEVMLLRLVTRDGDLIVATRARLLGALVEYIAAAQICRQRIGHCASHPLWWEPTAGARRRVRTMEVPR